MSDSTPMAATDQEVLITRIFDAPRERVFRAWTDPDEVAEWYGPEHFDTPRERIRIDLRVGGRYELTMVRRDGGGEFPIGYEILELVEPELIVLRSDPMPEVGMHEPTGTRVEFHDHGRKTRMTLSDGLRPEGAVDLVEVEQLHHHEQALEAAHVGAARPRADGRSVVHGVSPPARRSRPTSSARRCRPRRGPGRVAAP
jgi:uncharacterized protein YndB with AHSA1/START domain